MLSFPSRGQLPEPELEVGGDFSAPPRPLPPEMDDLLKQARAERGPAPELSADQRAAFDKLVDRACSSDVHISALVGYAGCGKTYLVESICDFLEALGFEIQLCALTHQAASVLSEKTCRGTVLTVHSMLGVKPDRSAARGYKANGRPKTLPGAVLIVDEASMMDRELLARLLREAARSRLHVVLVGDPAQLAPVGEKDVPFEQRVLEIAGEAGVARLSQVMRQAGDNPIPHIAAAYRSAPACFVLPHEARGNDGGVLIRKAGPTIDLFVQRMGQGVLRPEETTYLAWTNHAVQRLNQRCRVAVLGPEAERFPYLQGETLVANESAFDGDDDESQLLLANTQRGRVLEAEPTSVEGFGSAWNILLKVEERREDQPDRVELLAAPYESRKLILDALQDDARTGEAEFKAALAVAGLDAKWTQAKRSGARVGDFPDFARREGRPDLIEVDRNRRARWGRYYGVKARFADLRGPYSSTIHKAQGRSLKDALIDARDLLRSGVDPADAARLLYVALTRPTRFAVVLK